MPANIWATGRCLPERVVRNEDLTQFPRNSIPLIAQKTGVLERRHAAEGQCTSDLAIQAGRRCLEKAHCDPLEVEAIILSTSSPDRIQPATATRVQAALGAHRAFAFDLNAVCSGGLYALHLADALIRSRLHRIVLVVAAEIYSRYLNPKDFSTYPYFGDGAGAVLLRHAEQTGILTCRLKTDGSGADVIRVPAGGTMLPFPQVQNRDDCYFRMQGKEVFQFAVEKGSEILAEVMAACNSTPADVKYFITHQANINIIREFAARLQVGMDKFVVNLERYGNTASASVFIALDELLEGGRVQPGDLVVLAAFGGGLCWGGAAIRF